MEVDDRVKFLLAYVSEEITMVGEEQVQDTIREEFQLAAQWPHARHNGKIDRKHAPILAAESRHTRHVLLHPKQY